MKFKIIKSSVCDYSDVKVLVKGTIIVSQEQQLPQVM